MTGTPWSQVVLELLEDYRCSEQSVAESAARAVERSLAGYSLVPHRALTESALLNSRVLVEALVDGHPPRGERLAAAAHAAGERVSAGVPLADCLRAYRSSVDHITQALIASAARTFVAEHHLLEMVRLLWRTADEVSAQMADTYRSAELELAGADERQRVAFLRLLVSGGADTGELLRRAAALGIPPDRRYRALRVRPADDGVRADDLARMLRSRNRRGVVVAAVLDEDGDVAAVVIADDRGWDGGDLRGGLGPAGLLPTLPTSFAMAARLARVAARCALDGVHDIDSVGLLLPVDAETALVERLHERYVAPVADPAVLSTVAVWLDEDRSVKRTARRLDVHHNTVRHRLGRYEDLTGADLDTSRSFVEVWWALQVDRPRDGGDQRRPSADSSAFPTETRSRIA